MASASPFPIDPVPIDPAVLPLLACPACHGELHAEVERIVCAACARAYPVADGIPVLIADRGGQPRTR